MNKKKIYLLSLIALISVCILSGDEKSSPILPKFNLLSRTYSKEELDKILYIGMPKEEVIKKFGKPFSENKSYSIYSFPPSKIQKDKAKYEIGFSVFFNEGSKVRSWSMSFAVVKDPKKPLPKELSEELKKICLHKLYTKEELDKILQKGISPNEVIKIFGKPFIKNKIDNWSMFYYKINPDIIPSDKIDEYVGSFSIGFMNNKLIKWDPYYIKKQTK